ncbi:MAG TPA: penicillin-binding transpeptidase domain-containing protein, partial [Anaerolineaceae bacterium]|nr:penicillin-binding transpeptidase domain-containing protein [Anaerolineaceae bacterium]
MKLRSFVFAFLILALVTACAAPAVNNTPTAPVVADTVTPPLPTPQILTTRPPDARVAAQAYLEAWQAETYDPMYDLLTSVGQSAITREDFNALYKKTAINLTLQKMDFEILSTLVNNPESAQVAYRVTFKTAVVGDLTRDISMNLSLESGAWRVQWDDGLIMPEMHGGNRLAMQYSIPSRGNIYDRAENALVAETDAYSLAIWPGKIENENGMLSVLVDLTGRTKASIKASYEFAGADWYIPVGEAPAAEVDARMNTIEQVGGIIFDRYTTRYYFGGGIAPNVVGYVQPIPAEEIDQYRRAGYSGGEKVGMAGLEQWGEEYLAGQRGATLYVVDANGNIVTRLGQTDPLPAKNIYTTLDKTLQFNAQRAMEGFNGAIVVLERDSGRILAMVSSPGFDPNLFDPGNDNSSWLLADVFNPTEGRLTNRAAQSGYPLGSVFKIVTMAAALESELFTPKTTYECGLEFTELPGITLYDWTYEKGKPASGTLTLPEGLMRSCNPWFWHIGLIIYQEKGGQLLPGIARGFGLGSVTGLEGIDENPGSIIDSTTEGDSVQLAIGQGTMLVTPLQVANFVAAVGNGGTLYRPQIIEKIADQDGNAVISFEKQILGTLPVKQETLAEVQAAMK